MNSLVKVGLWEDLQDKRFEYVVVDTENVKQGANLNDKAREFGAKFWLTVSAGYYGFAFHDSQKTESLPLA